MMKKLIAIAALAGAVCAHAQEKMTPELLWSLKRVAAEGISPDGNIVYYAARTYDIQTEKSSALHYKIDLAAGKKTKADQPEGKTIIERTNAAWYATDDSKIYRSADQGKTWKVIADVPKDADNIRVAPDGKHIAFSKEVLIKKMDGKDIYPDLPKTTAQIYTDLNYRHWDTWEDGKFSHLFIADAKTGEAKDIMEGEPYDCPQKPFGGTEDFVWSPDGKKLLYVCKKKFGKEYAQSTNTDLYMYYAASGNTKNITEGMNGYEMSPAFSPDGTYLAFTSMKRDGYEADKNNLYVVDVDGNLRNITQDWDGNVNSFVWSNDSKHIYFNAPVKGTEQLFTVLPNGKTLKQLTEGKFDVTGIVGDAGNEIIVSRTDMNHAAEIFAVNSKTGGMSKLTHENDKVYSSLTLSKTELRMIKTTDNQKMGVWVIYPPGFDSTKKYPTLLYCQGGPQSALSQFYSFRWNFQLMAAQGYIVVAPNRRGMPGWGAKWNEAISKDWGGMPMQDYLTAIDEVAKESYVDKNRLGCVGASYGGYSVYMLAGMHEGRFKTFIAHDGLFDLKSWYGTTEELWFANWDIGGNYWDGKSAKSYEKYNPSNFVANWKTPILIIQGGIDFRVPVEQGEEAFQAAQLKGIKSKMLYFPNENHWILHPQNALVWQREFFKWLDETLK